jgi:type IV secretory pathway TraG/TraD family ATPase VirD4
VFSNPNIGRMESDAHPRDAIGYPQPNSISSLRDIHHLARHSIYIGIGTNGWMWAAPQRSALVLGPPRSGKTSSLVIPNILLADGPVVSTSTKPDVMDATSRPRAADGWAFLYDPSGEVTCPRHVERIGWSPLDNAARWDASVVTADAMVAASHPGSMRAAEHHWHERAGALLSTLLHAAAKAELPMRDVLRWIDRHDGAAALEILASGTNSENPPADLLAGIIATDAREQSGIWSTASGVLAAYRTDDALASTTGNRLDIDEFCGGRHTLYICSSGRRQRQFAPLVVGVLGDVRDAAYSRSRAAIAGPPVLLALDEVANIAPIPDLPAMVSEGGGQGLQILACLQDLSQARGRWGSAADGFLSLFGTTVVLRGIGDTITLRDVSALAGDHEVPSTTLSRSVGRWGRVRPSTSEGTTRQPRLPVDAIAHGAAGHALVLSPEKEVLSVELTPAHRHLPWRTMTGPERAMAERDRDAPATDRSVVRTR